MKTPKGIRDFTPRDALWTVFHVLFRHFNFPCECGLVAIGHPTPDSPVFLSGNYSYTVHLLKRALRGMDAYLLVADSAGSNVWCAAGMNEFTENDVVDAIRVADLAARVRRRRLVAPPYAAPGVDVDFVKRETGFEIAWGPAHLRDIPAYAARGFRCTPEMRLVPHALSERFGNAMTTAMSYALTSLIVLVFFPRLIPGCLAVIFGVHALHALIFPWLPVERRWRRTLVLLVVVSALLGAAAVWGAWPLATFLLWESILALYTILLAADMCGFTSIYKTTVTHWLRHGDYRSLFAPVVDPALCAGCGRCEEVCPKGVYARVESTGRLAAVRPERCMECLACLKQCPRDAVFNTGALRLKGDVKSIPRLNELTARDASHLRGEARWIAAEVETRDDRLVVTAVGADARPSEGGGHAL
jgi:NAD-dependent dihydropyrimidine dehydrogenase PreA subunit